MRLVVFGMSHRTAPIPLRESFAVPEDEMPALLARIHALPTVEEIMVVSTCNRVEAYAVPAPSAAPAEVHADLTRLMLRDRDLDVAEIEDASYRLAGGVAVHHLLRVAASLDSMVVGEPQILGQVKQAAHAARDAGTVGPVLGRLLDRAFGTAKAIRTRTDIARATVSIGSVAVDLAERIFERLADIRVLIVGAGKMAEATARQLSAAGAARVYVANRSYERALGLAERHGWHARALDELEDLLGTVDVVITSTGSPVPIIGPSLMKKVIKARKYRPLFLVDIAVPRDVDEAVGDLDTIYLYNVDDLEGISRSNLEERRQEAEAAERMVREELAELDRWFRVLELKPTLKAIRLRAEAIAEREMARTLSRRLGHLDLDEEERAALAKMLDATLSKVLHPTMAALRARADRAGGDELAAAARVLYGVEDEENE
ncbi:MAG: glutamyl-tRNA reductase [Myxococcota bacterium]